MNRNEAVEWMVRQRNQEIGFSSFKKCLDETGNHLDNLKIIHIAGTNGKGSTVAMLMSCLKEAGYRVGTFTSPHLYVHEDRIRINGKNIPEEDFLRIFHMRKEAWSAYHLSMFEMDLDLASIWFYEQKVDFVILEAGMGGKTDSTNVISSSLASVIVSIGLDHMERLGDTVEKIAIEKAGIIKTNGLVICGERKKSCADLIGQCAKQNGAEFHKVKQPVIISRQPLEFDYQTHRIILSELALYQVHNASCALETLLCLREKNLVNITDQQIAQGLYNAHWAGRFDVLCHHPLTIADGAHNAHGIEALLKSAETLKRPLTVVFACLRDKDKDDMIRSLSGYADRFILTEFDFYRAMNIDDFHSLDVEKIKDWKCAIQEAQKTDGTVLVTGSLYFISEVMTYFNQEMQHFSSDSACHSDDSSCKNQSV